MCNHNLLSSTVETCLKCLHKCLYKHSSAKQMSKQCYCLINAAHHFTPRVVSIVLKKAQMCQRLLFINAQPSKIFVSQVDTSALIGSFVVTNYESLWLRWHFDSKYIFTLRKWAVSVNNQVKRINRERATEQSAIWEKGVVSVPVSPKRGGMVPFPVSPNFPPKCSRVTDVSGFFLKL